MALDREYRIESPSRRCDACGREFGVGDACFAAVVETEGEEALARQEFCPDCWQPREAFFSFWRTRVPEPKEERRGPRLVDLARLMQLFERLGDEETADAQRFRYVLALALMRKRRLRLVQSRKTAGGGEELELREPGTDRTHLVRTPGLSEDEVLAVADRLREILDMPPEWEDADAAADVED